ncbi:DUF2690 domain-containing protein [Streptomyces monticola]|uniref:DUF2690 domain-containing protein n=1 Tax=Streptomyces monticola TaxID=2666263 RepID=A0ABW2JNM7_9ACTN
MPRWRALPEELDPQVREFASQLRRLVDRSGLSIAAVADRTGYSKTSWERYLNGRLLAPKGAIVALAEVTGTNPMHLTTMWELAERAWSRSEMRHDMTMEAIRISQARAALGELGTAPANTKGKKSGARGGSAQAGPAGPQVQQPGAAAGGAVAGDGAGGAMAGGGAGSAGASVAAPPGPPVAGMAQPPGPPGQSGTPGSAPSDRSPDRQRQRRKLTMFLAGVVGALVVIAVAIFLTGLPGEDEPEAKPSASPTTSERELPKGVKCVGTDCAGKDPERMRCGGELARTSTSVTVGTALVEVRYSKTCGASWARITGAQPGDTVQISGSQAGGRESGKVNADGDAYTPMVTAKSATAAKACATLQSGQTGCTG